MGLFFIETDTGQIATLGQLVESGLVDPGSSPPRPWHRIQGPSDASTLWYAVMRKQVRAGGRTGGAAEDSRTVYIGALAIRHQPHHASLLAQGWEEVEVGEIGVRGGHSPPPT